MLVVARIRICFAYNDLCPLQGKSKLLYIKRKPRRDSSAPKKCSSKKEKQINF